MNPTVITDEMLMAYADGELDASARAAVEAAMACDPEIARQVKRHAALRTQLGSAFDGLLSEPVPDRLIAAARASSTDAQNRFPAQRIRDAKSFRRWSWPEWTALAASLLIGVFLGGQFLPSWSGGSIATRDGQLVARGALARILSEQVSGATAQPGAIHIVLSFRDRAGDYCRAFSLRDEGGLAGLACRQNDTWQVRVLASSESAPSDSGTYRMAGTPLPQSVLQAVEERIAGDPLDAQGEAAAQRNGWK